MSWLIPPKDKRPTVNKRDVERIAPLREDSNLSAQIDEYEYYENLRLKRIMERKAAKGYLITEEEFDEADTFKKPPGYVNKKTRRPTLEDFDDHLMSFPFNLDPNPEPDESHLSEKEKRAARLKRFHNWEKGPSETLIRYPRAMAEQVDKSRLAENINLRDHYRPETPGLHMSWDPQIRAVSSGKDYRKLHSPFNTYSLLMTTGGELPEHITRKYKDLFGEDYDPFPLENPLLKKIKRDLDVNIAQDLSPQQQEYFITSMKAEDRRREREEMDEKLKETVFTDRPQEDGTMQQRKYDFMMQDRNYAVKWLKIGLGWGYITALFRVLPIYGYAADRRGRGLRVLRETLFKPHAYVIAGSINIFAWIYYMYAVRINHEEPHISDYEYRVMFERPDRGWFYHLFYRDTDPREKYSEDYRVVPNYKVVNPDYRIASIPLKREEEFDPDNQDISVAPKPMMTQSVWTRPRSITEDPLQVYSEPKKFNPNALWEEIEQWKE